MVLEFKAKTATEALEKIAYARIEQHWGCDQIIMDGLHFEMSDVQDYAKATLKNQPQLTIPKSVADALDVGDLLYLAWTHGNDLLGKVSDEERYKECLRRNAITKAYLAGKALGVDLVKVVEG